ncbi:MAG: MFS transporter [Patescibacteria group bacterium]
MKTAKNRNIIYGAGFLFSIALALTSYINSSFLKVFTSDYYIGIIYVIASLISILALVRIPNILNKIGNRATAFVFSIICFTSFLILAFSQNAYLVIPAFILNFISINFVFSSLDIFMEDFSKSSSVGKFRGMYLMFTSLAWVISQSLSGSIIEKSSFTGIYLISSMFMMLTAFMFVFFLHDFKDPKYKKIPILKTMKFFIKNKNILKIYFINLLLKFFFVWMVIYTPIYLHENLGFGWNKIGLIFTIMLTPFVFLSYPLGKISDKIGEKKLLILGFIISAFATSMIPLIKEPTFFIWALILFSTRVGAATIEVMSESYFFKSVNEENADEIAFFRNTVPVSYVIAPLLGSGVLLFIPSFEYIFYVLGAIMLIGVYLTLKIKDIK